MDKKKYLAVLSIVILTGIARSAEHDVKQIATLMDAYEKQVDSIKVKYTYKFPSAEQGVYRITKGVFAQKRSEGFILLDEKEQISKAWDDDRESTGYVRSYNGEVTRYFEHETNDHGYHMAAVHKVHNQQLYKTSRNPFFYVYRLNHKLTIAELLNTPDVSAEIVGEEEVDGVMAVKMSIQRPGSKVTEWLWLLPEKNYLPVRYRAPLTFEGEDIYWQMDWSDFKESDNGTVFPWKIESRFSDVAEPTIIEVDEVDFSSLTKEDFEFAFPPLTHVTDHVLGTKYLTTPTVEMEMSRVKESVAAQSSANNDDKEALLDKYVEKGKASPVPESKVDNTVKGVECKKKTALGYVWPAIIIVLVLAVGTAYVKQRRKQ